MSTPQFHFTGFAVSRGLEPYRAPFGGTKRAQMPELTAESWEGFVDLFLKMEGLVRQENGTCRFEARASHKGQEVAFARC